MFGICYAQHMKRTTVLLPDDIAKLLKLEAERRGVTPSQLVREAVTAHVNGKPGEPKGFLKLAGKFKSGHTDTAARMEELLDEMAEDIARESGLGPRDR